MYYEAGNNNIINLKIEKHEQNEHLPCVDAPVSYMPDVHFAHEISIF